MSALIDSLVLRASSLRPAHPRDAGFIYDVKKAALGGYIALTWGWNESFQRHFHARDFDPGRFRIITVRNSDAGFLAVEERERAVWVDQICLSPIFQGRGIGSEILRTLVNIAGSRRLPTRLQYLRVNPVGRLYRRLGFREIGARDHHVIAEHPPVP